jgi:hypothetical protein
MTLPVVEQLDLQGVIVEKAKMKSTMVIHVIRINLNQSNKIFTYQKLYLKSTHKSRQPLPVVGAAGEPEKGKRERKEVCSRREVNAINLNK